MQADSDIPVGTELKSSRPFVIGAIGENGLSELELRAILRADAFRALFIRMIHITNRRHGVGVVFIMSVYQIYNDSTSFVLLYAVNSCLWQVDSESERISLHWDWF